jgi:uncharacterized protein YbjT (DUF2867 family)
MTRTPRVLVTGATGNVGREVVAGLLAEGLPVRAVVRSPATAALPGGAEVVRGDLTDAGSLANAATEVDTAFLLWPFGTADGAAAVLDALAGGVKRVVYLSAMGAPDAVGGRTGPAIFHADMERHIERSGLAWTFLRPGGFATNTLMWAPQIRAGGVVRWPYAGARRSLIHERDIAAVAVRALTDDGHAGATHLLSGPDTISQADQVRTIGEVIGRPTRYEEIDRDAARRQLLAAWGVSALVDSALDTWSGFVAEPELVTDGVERVTGRPARAFREWAVDHAADFAAPDCAAPDFVAAR